MFGCQRIVRKWRGPNPGGRGDDVQLGGGVRNQFINLLIFCRWCPLLFPLRWRCTKKERYDKGLAGRIGQGQDPDWGSPSPSSLIPASFCDPSFSQQGATMQLLMRQPPGPLCSASTPVPSPAPSSLAPAIDSPSPWPSVLQALSSSRSSSSRSSMVRRLLSPPLPFSPCHARCSPPPDYPRLFSPYLGMYFALFADCVKVLCHKRRRRAGGNHRLILVSVSLFILITWVGSSLYAFGTSVH